MKRFLMLGVAALLCFPLVSNSAAQAQEPASRPVRQVEQGPQFNQHPNGAKYRGNGTRVRGFVQRRGGYSYGYSDSITDYRDTSILRDRQTMGRQGGPFDSDFFFESGTTRMNNSPYLN